MNENPFESEQSKPDLFEDKKPPKQRGGCLMLVAIIVVIIAIIFVLGLLFGEPIVDKYHTYRTDKSIEQMMAGNYDGDFTEFKYLLDEENVDLVESEA